jgi:hypothetical protein
VKFPGIHLLHPVRSKGSHPGWPTKGQAWWQYGVLFVELLHNRCYGKIVVSIPAFMILITSDDLFPKSRNITIVTLCPGAFASVFGCFYLRF